MAGEETLWYENPALWGIGIGASALTTLGTNFLNYGLQKDAFDYQKGLNERIFEREDTAIQRRMADAKAAGVNPYAVAGQGAGAGGSVSAPNAPHLKSGMIDALMAGVQAYSTIAQTQKAQAETQNLYKTGLILDADLAGKLDTNEIIGYNKQMAGIDLLDKEIGHYYKNMEYLADFGALSGNEKYSNWYKKYITAMNSDVADLMTKKISNDYNKAKFDWNTFKTDYDYRAEELAGLKLNRALDDIYLADERISGYNTMKAKEAMENKQLSWYNIEEGSSLLSTVAQFLRMLLK